MDAEKLVSDLRDAAKAYPADVFGETTDDDRKNHGDVVQRAAATMGRHMSPMLTEAAATIARLTAELDAARDLEVTPEMVKAGTLGRSITPNQATACFQSMLSARNTIAGTAK